MCCNPCHSSTFTRLLFNTHRYEVDIYEGRPWVGGKVASFKDKDGNHIEVCVCVVVERDKGQNTEL